MEDNHRELDMFNFGPTKLLLAAVITAFLLSLAPSVNAGDKSSVITVDGMEVDLDGQRFTGDWWKFQNGQGRGKLTVSFSVENGLLKASYSVNNGQFTWNTTDITPGEKPGTFIVKKDFGNDKVRVDLLIFTIVPDQNKLKIDGEYAVNEEKNWKFRANPS